MLDLLQGLIPVAMLVFVLSSMVSMGLGLTVRQILQPLTQVRLVLLSLVANFVVMPLAAVGLARSLRLDEPFGIGLLILGAAAGAPFLPVLAQRARANLAFAVGLMVLLMVATVGYLPIALPLFLPGVSVDSVGIAKSLFLLMLLPLAIALTVNAQSPNVAAHMKPFTDKASSLGLLILLALQMVVNISNVVSLFATGAILAGVLFIVIGYGAGWLLGGPAPDTKQVLGFGTAQRNIAAALVVGGQSFTDPKVTVMIVVVALLSLVVLMPLASRLSGRS
jgi:BASS family bile acid:Na+ symporter